MNAALAFAILSVVLLLASRIFDWNMSKIDLPVFRQQVGDYKMLGIASWFTDMSGNEIGVGRTMTVLRMAMLSASARAALSSLLTGLVGLAFTIGIVASAKPTLSFASARLGCAVGFSVIVIAAMIVLFARMHRGKLEPVPITAKGTRFGKRVAAYLRRHRHLKYVTIYTTVIFMANLITVLEAVGS